MINGRSPIMFRLAGFNLNLSSNQRKGVHPPMIGRLPLPAKAWSITGVTRDSTGVALGSVAVALIRTRDSLLMELATSDGSGNYNVTNVGGGTYYHIDAYKAGSPDVAGTTKNNLVGT